MNKIMMFSLLLLADTSEFTPIVDLIQGWGLAIVSAILGVVSIYMIFLIIKISFKIAKASADGDIEERSKMLNNLVWVIFAGILTFSATVIAGVFAGIFLN